MRPWACRWSGRPPARRSRSSISPIRTSRRETATDATIVGRTPVGPLPGPIAIDAAGTLGRVYAGQTGGSVLTVVDGRGADPTALTTRTVQVGRGPGGVAVDPENGEVFVASTLDCTISIVRGRLSTPGVPGHRPHRCDARRPGLRCAEPPAVRRPARRGTGRGARAHARRRPAGDRADRGRYPAERAGHRSGHRAAMDHQRRDGRAVRVRRRVRFHPRRASDAPPDRRHHDRCERPGRGRGRPGVRTSRMSSRTGRIG